MNQDVIDRHYTRLADDYNEFLYYSDEFVRTLTRKMIQKLDLHRDSRFVDLGCGTGMYSLDILKQVPLKHGVLGVDCFAEMLARIPSDAPIEPVRDDAMSFARRNLVYDRMLIKETIHHVHHRTTLFSLLFQQLSPGGRLLLVHVPPEVHYPLFDAALQRCRNWHADPGEVVTDLRAAGFNVERDGLDYPHSLPKHHYLNMVRGCYMSVLTSFEPAELDAGVREIERKYADVDVLNFTDHFDFITAVKPKTGPGPQSERR